MNKTAYPNKVLLQDVLAGLKALPSDSAQVIISDPPYNIGKDFGLCKDRLELTDYINWALPWIQESLRVLTPSGSLFIYGFSEILAHLLVHSNAPHSRWLVWHYTNKNAAAATSWQRSHESILVLSKNKPKFNTDLVREPYTETFLANAAGKTRAASAGRFGATESTYTAHEAGALPRDVLKHPALAGGAGARERAHFCTTCNALVLGKDKKDHSSHKLITHPTQKPLALTRRLIASAKNTAPGEPTQVAVLFGGSGAEGIAALQENCSFVGFDINPDFVKLANLWAQQQLTSQP